MFWSVCSSKGGSGTSVVAASIACRLAQTSDQPVLLIDFGGDQADILGVDTGANAGVVDWLMAEADVGVDALDRLAVDVVPGLRLLPRGSRSLASATTEIDADRCAQLATRMHTTAIADLGVVDDDPISPQALIAVSGDRTTAVLRACYLALRRATRLPVVLDDVVEVVEIGRSLTTLDVEAVVGLPVSSRLRVEPGIARKVDAGLLATRLPRALRRCADDLIATAPVGVRSGAVEWR